MPLLPMACTESGGGSDAIRWLILIGVLAAWALLTALLLRPVRDRAERRLLLGILIGSIVIGPLIIAAYYHGLFGSDSSIGKLAPLLAIPGVIGAVIAHLTRAANPLRAFFVGVWGVVFLISAGIFLLLVAVIVGGACLE